MSGIWQAMTTSDPIRRLGWMLLHSIWIGVAAAGLLAILTVFLRRRSANLRYAVSCMALLILVVSSASVYFLAAGQGAPDSAKRADAGGSQTMRPVHGEMAQIQAPALTGASPASNNQGAFPAS